MDNNVKKGGLAKAIKTKNNDKKFNMEPFPYYCTSHFGVIQVS